MKKPTFEAIQSIVETVDFGFTPAVKQDSSFILVIKVLLVLNMGNSCSKWI